MSGPPILTAACHCTDCQRMTAGPYSLSALFSDEQFELVAGDVVVGSCKSAGQHNFCSECFSWVYTKPAGLAGMVNIRTPLLDHAADFLPFAEFFHDDAIPGTECGAPLSFGSAPPVEEFLKLADSYAEWEHRPG